MSEPTEAGQVEWATGDPDFPDQVWRADSEEQARRRAKRWPHVPLLTRTLPSWTEVKTDA